MDKSPAPQLKVVLDPDYTAALRETVMTTITDAVEAAREQTGIDSQWVSGKKHIAQWLDVSTSTLNVLINQRGLPVHYLGDADVFVANKHELNEFMKTL